MCDMERKQNVQIEFKLNGTDGKHSQRIVTLLTTRRSPRNRLTKHPLPGLTPLAPPTTISSSIPVPCGSPARLRRITPVLPTAGRHSSVCALGGKSAELGIYRYR